LAISGLSLLPAVSLGVPLQLITGEPNFYAPGDAVEFGVRLPEITNLGSYNIDLVLESNTGTAGVDFFFDVAATVPASTNYVFTSAANFFDAVNVDSSIRHRITLTDFDLSGANIVTGVNDRVATVVFRTAQTFKAPLTLFVDAPALILDTPDVEPTSVMEFEMIQAGIAEAPPIELTVVPEPSTVILSLSLPVLLQLNVARYWRRKAKRAFGDSTANNVTTASVD
jgi:hypothetical protein